MIASCLYRVIIADDTRLLQKVYLVSMTICTVGAVVAGTAKSIGVLIGMRCLQAIG